MEEDEEDLKEKKKTRTYIGGIIFIVIVIVILLNIDIKEVINSKQFQSNINYIEQQAKGFWNDYLSAPIKNTWNGMINNLIDQSAKQIKDNLNADNINLNNINLGTPGSTETKTGQ